MDLNKIIPNNDNWSVSKGIIYFKKMQKIPVCILGDEVLVILDNKIPKQVIELVKNLMKAGVEFYFTVTGAENPSGILDYKKEVIRNYLYSYANIKFYLGFNKIGFDLIKNLIDWSDKNDAWYLVKPIYEVVNKKIINHSYFDFYTQKEIYDYSFEIREEFRTLWREIQINKVL